MDAAARRLQEELGVVCPLREIGHFVYLHRFSDNLFEYECDHVLLGYYAGQVAPNPEEIAQTVWVGAAELCNQLQTETVKFAPWFLTAAPIALEWMENRNILQ